MGASALSWLWVLVVMPLAHHQLAFVSIAKLGLFASIFRPHTPAIAGYFAQSARSVSESRALLLSTMTANQCTTHFLFVGGKQEEILRLWLHKRVDCAPGLKSEGFIFRTFICMHDRIIPNREFVMLLSPNLKRMALVHAKKWTF